MTPAEQWSLCGCHPGLRTLCRPHLARPAITGQAVWHLVDVLHIGSERLLTLIQDPDRGITCWDENAPTDPSA